MFLRKLGSMGIGSMGLKTVQPTVVHGVFFVVITH